MRNTRVLPVLITALAIGLAGCDAASFDPGQRTACAMSAPWHYRAAHDARLLVTSGCPARDWHDSALMAMRDGHNYWAVAAASGCDAPGPTSFKISEEPAAERGLVRFDPNGDGSAGNTATVGIQRAPGCGHVESDIDIDDVTGVGVQHLKLGLEMKLVHQQGVRGVGLLAYLFAPDGTWLGSLGVILRPNGDAADPRTATIPSGGQHPPNCMWFDGVATDGHPYVSLDAGCNASGFPRLASLTTTGFTPILVDWDRMLQWVFGHVGAESPWRTRVQPALGTISATVAVELHAWDQGNPSAANASHITVQFRKRSMWH